MAKGPTYTVTIELNPLELALLYHTVTHEQDEYRTVFWRAEGVERPERHYVSRNWLAHKVFGQIAQAQPEWLPMMEAAQKRLTPHEK